MKALSTDRQNSIISLLQRGLSISQVARQLGLSKSTISKYKNIHLQNLEASKGGNVFKLSNHDKAKIRRKILAGTWRTAAEVRENLVGEGHELSLKTVYRLLKSMGFEARKKIKKPLLSKKHKKARYEWAKAHKLWTLDDWRRVIFSDETKINVWGSDGCRYYWTRRGDPIQEHHLNLTVKHGGGSLMMWGCMTYSGIGYGCRIDGTMSAKDYCEILGSAFKDTLEHWGLEKERVIFQQDNDPKHTSKLAKEWFAKENIEVLPWPAQSPDLNPIEHLWNHLKLKLAKYERKAQSVHELWERCDKEWNSFSTEECRKYIDSMPARVQAVFKAKGGHTRF
jgi:transposase